MKIIGDKGLHYLTGDMLEGIKLNLDTLTATYKKYTDNTFEFYYTGDNIIRIRTLSHGKNCEPDYYIDTLLTDIAINKEDKTFTFGVEYINRRVDIV
jgi:hypothetical protein